MFKNKPHTKIVVNQKAQNMTNVTGVRVTGEPKNNQWVVSVGSGVIVLLIGIIITPGVTVFLKGGNVADKNQEQKVKNVDVNQVAKELNNVKGVDIQRTDGTIEIDSLKVNQQGERITNTTGVSMKSGGAPGSIVAKGSWDIRQQTPNGETRVQINPTNSPNVHVEFCKVKVKEEQ